MSDDRSFSYFWSKHVLPLLLIPLIPFMLLFGILNHRLQSVPASAIPMTKTLLRILFGLAFVVVSGVALLSVLDHLGFLSVALFSEVGWRFVVELFLMWLSGGFFTLYIFVTHGNWQIRKTSP